MDDAAELSQRITQNWFARADRLEDYWRDYAFLGLNEELRFPAQTCRACGGLGFVAADGPAKCQNCDGRGTIRRKIAVLLLTLRMFVQLCAVRSPFLVGGRVGPEHVAQILWRLSPDYDSRLTTQNARVQYVAKIADLPFNSAVRAINRYLDRMLIDKPPAAAKSDGSKPDTSFAASMVHALAKTYGWSDDVILDLPMPRIFQYLRRIRRDNDPELASFNPVRDRFVKYVTDKVIEAKNQEAESLLCAFGAVTVCR